MAKQQAQSVTAKGQVFYCHNTQVNQMSGKYQVDIGQLSVAAQAALEDLGLDIKNKDTQGAHVTCKSKFPIRLYDEEGNEIEFPLANGSQGVFKLSTYEYTSPQGQKGVSPKLIRATITEAVEYSPDDEEDITINLDEAL